MGRWGTLLAARIGGVDLADGAVDATEEIQAQLDGAAARGGEVRLPAGTFTVSMRPVPGFPGYHAALVIPSGVRLVGEARGATIIKLAANEQYSADAVGAMVVGNADLDGGDENIEVADLTIDGNAANQTGVHNGLELIRVRGAKCTRVTVKNCRGTSTSGATETFHYNAVLSADLTFTDCEAIGDDAGATASGFATNGCTNVSRVGCVARGMSVSNGFTDYQSANITHSGCFAYDNGNIGFNAEDCHDLTYAGCHAGIQAAKGADGVPFTSLQAVGNNQGFVMNGVQRWNLDGCHASQNTGTGLIISNDYAGCSGKVAGGSYRDNGYAGISITAAADPTAQWITPEAIIEGNGSAQVEIPTYGWISAHGLLAAPAVPASGVALANPFPMTCDVQVGAGAVDYIQVNGATVTGLGHGLFRLRPGDTIQIGYSAAPSWTWFAA